MATQPRTALITGNSSGLGLGFTRVLNADGWAVHGLSRRGCPEPVAGDVRVDLADLDAIGPAIQRLLAPVERLDLVILNAGVLGRIEHLSEADIGELRRTMDINLFANKPILDHLIARRMPVGRIIAISSGAVKPLKSWTLTCTNFTPRRPVRPDALRAPGPASDGRGAGAANVG